MCFVSSCHANNVQCRDCRTYSMDSTDHFCKETDFASLSNIFHHHRNPRGIRNGVYSQSCGNGPGVFKQKKNWKKSFRAIQAVLLIRFVPNDLISACVAKEFI